MNKYTKLAHKSNYGNERSLETIKYLVYHYTANDGDTDTNNALYFQNNPNLNASAHYFVDDDSITQSVMDNFEAWHCGGKFYYHDECRNANSIGIEMCDTVKDGVYNLSSLTEANAIELGKELMAKYSIPIDRVLRHYDVTHKKCPAYLVNETEWLAFKNKLVETISVAQIYRVRKSWSDVSSQIGAYKNLDNAKKACGDGYYVFDENGNVVYPIVQVTNPTIQVIEKPILQSVGVPSVEYQVYSVGKWLPNVKDYTDYAGIEYRPIQGIAINLNTKGDIVYRVHMIGRGWLPEVVNRSDYAGLIGRNIDGIQIRLVGLPEYEVIYRVSTVGSKNYLPEVKGYSDYAGIFGQTIDKVQIKITKK